MPSRTPLKPALGALVAVLLVLRFGAGDRPLAAADVDALAGGGVLLGELAEEGRLGARLVAGFGAARHHPEARSMGDGRDSRLRVADPPLPRWLVSAAGGQLDGARWISSALVALSALLVGFLAGIWWLGAVVFLALPGVWDAAAGATSSAVAAAAMVMLLLAVDRLGRGRGGGVAVGITLGLALAVHPAALFLLVPLFVTVAIARRAPREDGIPQGSAPLPAVPLSLFAAPVVALVVLVALWPSLWSETGKHLGAWLTDTWWLLTGALDVAGVRFSQGEGGRGPMAWVGVWSWAAWTSPLLVLAWLAGLRATVRAGGDGHWGAVLMWVTVVLVAGVDGGLFGGRLDLLAWLWGPTAITAAVGVQSIHVWTRDALGRLPAGLVAAALVAPSLVAGGLGLCPPGLSRAGAGASERMPLPLAELRAMADESAGDSVFIMSGKMGYRYALETVTETAGVDLRWADLERATWVVLVDTGAPKVSAALAERSEDEPSWHATVAGVEMWGFR